MNKKQKLVFAYLEYFSHPERGKTIIHLAGTNGKGSTGAYIAGLLRAHSKEDVGHFTSPHVLKYNERISINGKWIEDQKLEMIDQEINRATEETGLTPPSYFVRSFLQALLFFKDCRYMVIETGIGGLEDCTNILDSKYQVLSPISLDHLNILGSDIRQIAYQKAGIIKKKSLVFTSFQKQEVMEIIEETCKKKEAKLFRLDSSFIQDFRQEDGFQVLSWQRKWRGDFFSSMLGYHQVMNLSLALLFAEEFPMVEKKEIHEAIQKTILPGRLQLISRQPFLWIDGAHNDAAMEMLVKNMELLKLVKPALVFGMHDGKISSYWQERLFRLCGEKIILPVEDRKDQEMQEDMFQALNYFQDRKEVLVTGSFYLLAGALLWANLRLKKEL